MKKKEIVFPRKNIDKDLEYWFNNESDKVLLVKGARQTGKTFYIRRFISSRYSNIFYIDLSTNQRFIRFISEINESKLKKELSKYLKDKTGTKFKDNSNTVLVIDEAQLSYEVLNSIRMLRNNLSCHIIFVGSYMDYVFAQHNTLVPAGDTFHIEFTPLTMGEFRDAVDVLGIKDTPEYSDFFQLSKNSNNIMNLKGKLYVLYRYLGGFPQVLETFCKSNYNLSECNNVFRDLWRTFCSDCYKYTDKALHESVIAFCVLHTLVSLKKKRVVEGKVDLNIVDTFMRSCLRNINEGTNLMDITFMFMKSAGLLGECIINHKASFNGMPKGVRYYIRDIGLSGYLGTMFGMDIHDADFAGILTECYVYNELCNSTLRNMVDCVPHSSVYDNYELDFIIRIPELGVFGIEVKTRDGLTKSLDEYAMRDFIKYKLKFGFFKAAAVQVNTGTLNYPLADVGELDFHRIAPMYNKV